MSDPTRSRAAKTYCHECNWGNAEPSRFHAEACPKFVPHATPDRVEIPTVVVGKWHPVHQHRWVWFNPPLTISEFRAARQDHLHTA